MKPRTALIAGAACLLAAQLLASFAIKPLRASTVAAGETFTALKPGEFAGTLCTAEAREATRHPLYSHLRETGKSFFVVDDRHGEVRLGKN